MFKNYFLTLILLIVTLPVVHGQSYKAILQGSNQPLPVVTTASGMITAELTEDTLALSGSIQGIISGVDTSIVGGAHIHQGSAGQNGGVELVLRPTLSDGLTEGVFEVATNTLILSEEQKALLAERQLYINVHSNDHGAGEIRGQIVNASSEVYTATLFGSNQNPSVMTDAKGSIVVELLGDTSIIVTGSFDNLSSNFSASHIHVGLPGSTGGVVIPLSETMNPDGISGQYLASQNTFDIDAEQLAMLKSEEWYVNVHSANFPAGEIRGQVLGSATVRMRTHLTGMSEVAPVLSTGNGKLTVTLRDSILTVSGTFSGLESNVAAAHIHSGMSGRNGPVLFPLVYAPSDDSRGGQFLADSNTFVVTGDDLAALLGRALYINIHTAENPGGELRGQIVPESHYFFNALLVGSQHVPTLKTRASGSAVVEILGNQLTVSGSFQNLSSPLLVSFDNGAHIHFAPVGSRGPHYFNLMATPDDDIDSGRFRAVDNVFDISDTQRDSLRARLGYISVHSENHMPGEIRGQLLHESMMYFYTPLSGGGQTPSVNTDATGAVAMEYNGSTAVIAGSFNALSSGVATDILGGGHIHLGLAGSSGPVMIPLSLNVHDSMTSAIIPVMDNMYPVTSGFVDTVRQRSTYVNIHSLDYAGGEIRGNFRPIAQNYFAANLRGRNASTPAASTGQGLILVEQAGNQLTASGSFNNLEGDFATDIAGGAHIHSGSVGMNGGILQGLKSLVAGDLKSAQFLADSNTVSLPDSTLELLFDGDAYVNIHSTTVPAGEIRGQLLHEINLAPSSPEFIGPEYGDTIVTTSTDTMAFLASWSESSDPNGDDVVYLWQLSLQPGFDTALVTVNTGSETSFGTTVGMVDTLLALLGLDSGQVTTLYHRVVASDGSLASDATVDSVLLVRDVITNLEENPYLESSFRLFPNPAISHMNLEVDVKQAAAAQLRILDISGAVMKDERLQLIQGLNIIRRSISALPSGTYLTQLVVDGQVSVSERFIKR